MCIYIYDVVSILVGSASKIAQGRPLLCPPLRHRRRWVVNTLEASGAIPCPVGTAGKLYIQLHTNMCLALFCIILHHIVLY